MFMDGQETGLDQNRHWNEGREVESIRRNSGPGFKLKLITIREQNTGFSRMALLKTDFREADLITAVQI